MVITTTQKTKFTLLDSGATENFLDPRTVERLRIPIRKLSEPRIIYNIDGTLNKAGSITHRAQLQVTFGKETRTVDFFITDLGQDRAVLGFPFLRDFNPNINWNEGTIKPEPRIFVTPVQLWEHRWRVWKYDGHRLLKLDFLRRVSFAQQWAAEADKAKERMKEAEIPPKYQEHHRVFSEEGAK